jgi:hypothetical protein
MPAAVGYAAPLPVIPDSFALPTPANVSLEPRSRETMVHNPVREPDATEHRFGRTGRVKAFVRPRGRPDDLGARRGDGRAPRDHRSVSVQLDFGAHSSPFLAQVVAQHEPPGQAPNSQELAATATTAYELVQRRSEAYIGLLIPTEIRV